MFIGKGDLKICNKFTGEHPCRRAFSIKLQSNFIEITLWYGCYPVNLVHIIRTPFPKSISGGLPLLKFIQTILLEKIQVNKTPLTFEQYHRKLNMENYIC